MTRLVVPSVLTDGRDEIRVQRAWPRSGDPELVTLRVEGRDELGHVRAGEAVLGRDGSVASVRLVAHGLDPRLPGLAHAGGRVVGHRLGRRAVSQCEHRFTKVVRPSAAASTLSRNAMGSQLAARAGFLAPEVAAGPEGTMHLSVLPGRSLEEAAMFEPQEWLSAWDAWGAAWPDFTASPVVQLPQHSPQREADVLMKWVRGAAEHGVLEAPTVAVDAAREVASHLFDGAAQPLVASHRDLHDQQIFFDATSGGVALLDLDTLAAAEPALDLGNLAAHVEWRVAQGDWSTQQGVVALTRIVEVAEYMNVDLIRLHLAVRAAALRLGAVNCYRPALQRLAGAWTTRWALGEPSLALDLIGPSNKKENIS